MIITITMFAIAIGFFVGYAIKRYQINKIVKQMLRLEEQKRLLQTRHIINLEKQD